MTKTKLTLRSATAILGSIVSLGLAGCTMEERALEHEYVANSGSEQYPIEVVNGPATLNVANKGGSLTPAQINAISGFARKAGHSTTVTVSRPSGASARLAHEVANLVSQNGVPAHLVRVNHYHGAASGPIKVTYSQLRAKTGECGDWSRDVTDTRMNELASNHGCAVQSNMAAMVDDPTDFQAPTEVDPATAASRLTSLHKLDGSQLEEGQETSTSSNPTGGSGGANSSGSGGSGGGDTL